MAIFCETCCICTRECYEGEKTCDDCIDFFINYIESTEIAECKNSNQCLNVPSLEGANCEECRAAKCVKAGIKIPEFMDTPTENVYIDPEFIQFVMDSLTALNQPLTNPETN
uniref:Nuclear receptor domain-containing protein n=1 Tax=Panagrolaimus davidi TaxID=227884 RepID=A0A914QZF3_9BILA